MEVLISSFNRLCIVPVMNFHIFHGRSHDYGPTVQFFILFIYFYHIFSIFIFDIAMDYRL